MREEFLSGLAIQHFGERGDLLINTWSLNGKKPFWIQILFRKGQFISGSITLLFVATG
jgi:hypothetical protein